MGVRERQRHHGNQGKRGLKLVSPESSQVQGPVSLPAGMVKRINNKIPSPTYGTGYAVRASHALYFTSLVLEPIAIAQTGKLWKGGDCLSE